MHRLPCYLCVAAAIVAVGGVDVRAQTTPPRRPTSAILLDNGHLLRGQIVDEGERVMIRLGPGSQLRLARGRVRAVASSPRELFQMQHRQLQSDDVTGRIDLARWCIRNDLRADAGQVVAELIALAPRNSHVASLEQQLRQSLAKPESPSPREAQPPTQADPATQPTHDESLTGESLTGDHIAAFAQHVQPILLNHCSAAGCHGVLAKSDFQLLRPYKARRLTQRMTSRNLASAMKFVHAAQPLESPLLLAAIEPHGQGTSPILDGPRMALTRQLLVDWLASFQKDRRPSDLSTPREETRQPHSQRVAQPPLMAGDGEQPPVSVAPRHDTRLPDMAKAHSTIGARSIDPFDPGAFNRRFFPERMKERSPLDATGDDHSPSKGNEVESSARKNAVLLESKPGSSPRAAGESH